MDIEQYLLLIVLCKIRKLKLTNVVVKIALVSLSRHARLKHVGGGLGARHFNFVPHVVAK